MQVRAYLTALREHNTVVNTVVARDVLKRSWEAKIA